MFNTQSPIDRSIEEGSVTEVDVVRKVCKVKTLRGQALTGVRWMMSSGGSSREGDRITPVFGDSVVIHFGLGYPLIIGFLGKPDLITTPFPLIINDGQAQDDTGNFTDSGKNVIPDPNAPADMVVGDRIIGSTGGGILGLLRGGSVFLRSSPLAQIFMSKFDDLVRLVARNYELFTDVSSTVIKNLQGRVYSYTGYSITQQDAKVENYSFHQYAGDTAVAEAVKTGYADAGTLPAQNTIIYKEQVTTGSGGGALETLHREISLDGTHDLVVTEGSGSSATFTRIQSTNGQVQLTYKDVNIVLINDGTISLTLGGDPISVVLTPSNIVSTFNGAVTTMSSSGIQSTFDGGTWTMNSSGISSSYSGGVHQLTSSGVSSTYGGHFCNVTSSGVQLG